MCALKSMLKVSCIFQQSCLSLLFYLTVLFLCMVKKIRSEEYKQRKVLVIFKFY